MQSKDRGEAKQKTDSVQVADGVVQVSDVVAGLEWVGLNHKLPAVVTMSLGVKVWWETSLQSAPVIHLTCIRHPTAVMHSGLSSRMGVHHVLTADDVGIAMFGVAWHCIIC